MRMIMKRMDPSPLAEENASKSIKKDEFAPTKAHQKKHWRRTTLPTSENILLLSLFAFECMSEFKCKTVMWLLTCTTLVSLAYLYITSEILNEREDVRESSAKGMHDNVYNVSRAPVFMIRHFALCVPFRRSRKLVAAGKVRRRTDANTENKVGIACKRKRRKWESADVAVA